MDWGVACNAKGLQQLFEPATVFFWPLSSNGRDSSHGRIYTTMRLFYPSLAHCLCKIGKCERDILFCHGLVSANPTLPPTCRDGVIGMSFVNRNIKYDMELYAGTISGHLATCAKPQENRHHARSPTS